MGWGGGGGGGSGGLSPFPIPKHLPTPLQDQVMSPFVDSGLNRSRSCMYTRLGILNFTYLIHMNSFSQSMAWICLVITPTLKRRGCIYNSMLFSMQEICSIVYLIPNSFRGSVYKKENP